MIISKDDDQDHIVCREKNVAKCLLVGGVVAVRPCLFMTHRTLLKANKDFLDYSLEATPRNRQSFISKSLQKLDAVSSSILFSMVAIMVEREDSNEEPVVFLHRSLRYNKFMKTAIVSYVVTMTVIQDIAKLQCVCLQPQNTSFRLPSWCECSNDSWPILGWGTRLHRLPVQRRCKLYDRFFVKGKQPRSNNNEDRFSSCDH